MLRTARKRLLCMVLLLPSLCLATENVRAQSSDVALRVASLLDTRSMMMLGFKSMLPNETARDLADRLLAEYPDIWSKLDREYADLLSQTFSESQLHELHHFFSSDTGQAWIKSAPEIFANFQNSSTGTNSLLFRFSSIGCVVGLLAPNIDVAKQRAGNDQPGVPSELYETIEPLREASTLTCDCILTKGLEKWPSSAVMQLQLQPGFQEYAQELLSSGSCPMPIPQKQKGVNE